MPNRIRILRTTKANTSDGIKDIILTDGQPFYNKSTNYLYIGNGLTNLSQLKSITAENATITNTDSGNNANIKFKIGIGEYSKIVNNVVHSTNADNAINVNTANKNTGDNAIINFQLGNGTEFKKTVNNVAQANNASLVQNVDFSSNIAATFGQTIVPKLRLINNKTITATTSAKSAVATFSETISSSDLLLIEVEIYRTGKYFIVGNIGTKRLWIADNFSGIGITANCDLNITTTSIQIGQVYMWASTGITLTSDANVYRVYRVIL